MNQRQEEKQNEVYKQLGRGTIPMNKLGSSEGEKVYDEKDRGSFFMMKKKKQYDPEMGSRESLGSTYSVGARKFGNFYAKEMESIISSWTTPLHNAAAEGRCDQLNLLLEYPEVDINIQTKQYNEYEGVITLDNTPLHLAAEKGHSAVVSLLLKHGARCDIQNTTGCTPLHLASINGVLIEIVQSLVKDGTAIGISDRKGRSSLFCAAEEGCHHLVGTLVDHGEDIERTDFTGETPLIAATKNGFSQTMKVLIENGAYMSTRDKQGHHALDYALKVNEKSIQDEQIFDEVLANMLNAESKDNALNHLMFLLRKYERLRLKSSIVSLLKRIPELRARKVIICSKYLERDAENNTPNSKNFSNRSYTALQMLADTEDPDLAFNPTVRVVVDKKMQKVGNFYLIAEIIFYLLFLFCLFFIFTAAAYVPNPKNYNSALDYSRVLGEIFIAIVWAFSVASEIMEITNDGRRIYHKTTLFFESENKDVDSTFGVVLSSVLKLYLKDPYNYFDILGLICLFLVLPLRIAASSFQWVFAAFSVILHFFRFIKVIRLLPGFGTYVHTITLIILYDVPKFSMVSLTIVLVSVQAFFLAIRVPFEGSGFDNESVTTIGIEGLYNEYFWTFLMFLRILVQGESVLDGNYLFMHLNWLQAFIYLISLSLIIVILLNIFIAQVSDTYANAKSKSQRIVAYYRLKYISRVMLKSFGKIRKKGYLDEIILKSNYWKEYLSHSDEKLEEINTLLERQQTNIEQFKQQLRVIKQLLHGEDRRADRSIFGSINESNSQSRIVGPYLEGEEFNNNLI